MQTARMTWISLIAIASISVAAQAPPGAAAKTSETIAVHPQDSKKVDAKTAVVTTKAVTTQKAPDAVAVYQLRVEQQHQLGNHKAEAIAAFNAARASEATGDPAKLSVAETGYRQSIQAATEASDTSQKTLATNNLAVLMLKQGKKTEALSLLKTVDPSSVSPEQRPLYTYNLARSLELNGDSNTAFGTYTAAYKSNPEFVQAASAAFRVLQSSSAPRIKDALGISDAVIDHGHSEVASQHLPMLLLNWGSDPDAQRLLAELLRCYTAQHVTPDKFKAESKVLSEAAQKYSGLTKPIGDINEAFFGKIPPTPQNYYPAVASWYGASWKGDAIGPMLKMVGDWYSDQKQYSSALGRYATAWSLTRDPSYALAFVSLVRREPDLASQRDYLISKLVDSMFEAKGDFYRVNNWPNILRMHTAIGTIFEDEKRWGSEYDPHSAIFQWKYAIRADQQIRMSDPQAAPAPGLHYHLATCLAAVGQKDQAAAEYLAAAELYVKAQDGDAAGEAVQQLSRLGKTTGTNTEQVNAVKEAIRKLKTPA